MPVAQKTERIGKSESVAQRRRTEIETVEAARPGIAGKAPVQLKTSFDGGMFNSDALKTFRDMQDNQVAKEMSSHGSLGLAKAIAAFLDRDGKLAKADAAATKGGVE